MLTPPWMGGNLPTTQILTGSPQRGRESRRPAASPVQNSKVAKCAPQLHFNRSQSMEGICFSGSSKAASSRSQRRERGEADRAEDFRALPIYLFRSPLPLRDHSACASGIPSAAMCPACRGIDKVVALQIYLWLH